MESRWPVMDGDGDAEGRLAVWGPGTADGYCFKGD